MLAAIEVQPIDIARLAIALVPVLIVVAILYCWSVDGKTTLVAVARMLIQLLAVGYVLTFIFELERASAVIAVLAVMLCAASWIALRPTTVKRRLLYAKALGSIAVGGIATLLLVTQSVLQLEPWFRPDYMIPLAGMIFATAMNTVSLAAERFGSEINRGAGYDEARRAALRAALIPLVNSLLAVGIVSLPGMMTGQILSGIPPFVAVRYQIMVMCMIFGSAGISAACFLVLIKSNVADFKAGATS